MGASGRGVAPAVRPYGRPLRVFTVISIVMVAAGLGSMVSMPTVFTVLIGMLPAVVAFVVDNRPGRHAFQCVAALNFAGVAPVVVGLWQGGVGMDSAAVHLLNPFNLFSMYGAAAIGWGLVWLAPLLTTVFIHAMLQYRANRLRAEDAALEQDWDFASRNENGI